MRIKTTIISIALLASVMPCMAEIGDADTCRAVKRKSFFDKFLDYFNDANKNKHDRKFDFSIIGGPHYSTDTKLGLGLVAAGLYKTDRRDSLLPPSDVSLFSDVSTVGFYMLGIRGNNIMPKDRARLDYTVYFYSFPSRFWGVGYDMGNNDDNESDMKRWQARVRASLLVRVAENLYVGPTAMYDFVKASDMERPELLAGMSRHASCFGMGLSLVYDSRDVLTNPHRGARVAVSQYFRPRFIGNSYTFSTTDIAASAYRTVWGGGVLAAEVRSVLNSGDTPWALMALLGGSNSMRGYYEGRYRDKNKIEGQVELRQHVWKRNGITAWIGAGSVFDRFSSLRVRRILPNYGIGYRWEFKKNVNVRLDYGFGKNGQSGFLFNINEAF
ncbi:MAG: BamA/TamA family outer membrane protein [Prevotella sp.]|nr:BamA/TamA family outer membrane protein [Prevotella sp.]